MLKVAIVDQYALVAEGLRRLLDGIVDVMSTTPDFAALCMLLENDPSLDVDVILAEFVPKRNYQQSLSRLRAARPNVRIVALWEEDTIERMVAIFKLGCDGFILKDVSLSKLSVAIQSVNEGQKLYPSQLLDWLADHVPNSAYLSLAQSSPEVGLTIRELGILRHVALGQANKVIAHEVGITESTVKVHLKGILKKIRVQNRTQAAIWAVRNGIVASDALPAEPKEQILLPLLKEL